MKSVDWLDVYVRHGAERVRDAVLGAVAMPTEPSSPAVSAPSAASAFKQKTPAPPHQEQGDGDGEAREAEREPRLIPAMPIDRARLYLQERFAPGAWTVERGWPLRRWDEMWWRHDGVKYQPMSEEMMRGDIQAWLCTFSQMKTVKGEDGGERKIPVKFVPKDSTVSEVVNFLKSDTLIDAKSMPVWITEEFVSDGAGGGVPVWASGAGGASRRGWQRVHTEATAKAAGLPDPRETIIWSDCVMNTRAWADGKVRTMPHSERLFTASALPYACPVKELMEVGDDEEALDALIVKLSPVWNEFLAIASEGDGLWQLLLAQYCGYILTPWMMFEVILLMTGASRAGKGVIEEGGIMSLVGPEGYASSSTSLINMPFHIYTLIGKNAIIMPDADVGRHTDATMSSENLKKMSAGDPMYADRKHKDPVPAVRLTGKIVMMSNRMPSLPDPSGALANRFLVLPFTESYAGKEDKRFKDPAILEREAVGRMLWALRGLRSLMREGKFAQPERGLEMLDEYRDYSDPLRKFKEDCLVREDAWTAAADLYAAWKAWCGTSGREARSHEWFCMQLRTACPWIRREQRRVDLVQRWGYRGVSIAAGVAMAQGTVYGHPDEAPAPP